MRRSFTAMFLALAPVAALTTLVPTAPAQAQQAAVSVSLFYEQLSPHGKWVEHPRWGWVWYPVAVEADWRPYTKGRWVWTDQHGWMWVSYEPFGWATYHYGRWGYDDRYGWVWVPGQTWGPAWVAFRYSDRHVGWAPLPPDTLHVSAGIRIDDAILTASYYQPRWVFVETRHFVAPQVFAHAAPPARNVAFIRETRNVTNIRIQNNIVINRSIEPERLRAVVRTEIPRVRVQEVQDARRIDVRQRNRTTINNIQVFKKDVNITRETRPPERARAKEGDRPKVRVQEEAVRPEDRRDGRRRDRATPGAPPSDRGQPDRGTPDRRDAQPDRDRTPDRRGAQPDRDRTTPPGRQRRDERGTERRDDTPSRTQPDRRGATPAQPAQPPRTAPGAPPSRGQDDDKRGATPAKPATPPARGRQDDRRGERPDRAPPRTQDDRRGATPAQPAQPPRTSPGAPPTRGQDDKRGATPAKPATPAQPPRATPAQPPKAAPGAPPSRQAPPQQNRPQRGQPQRGQPAKPSAPGKGPDKDEKERGPSR